MATGSLAKLRDIGVDDLFADQITLTGPAGDVILTVPQDTTGNP